MKFKKRIVLITITIMIINLLIGCGNNTDKIYFDNSKIADEYDTLGLDVSEETVDEGSYKGNLKLSGSGTIWKYESSEDFDLKVPYYLSVKSGKAKIVLISPDNTVVTLVENTDKSSLKEKASVTIPIKKGTNRIKVVGYKKANIEIEVKIEKGTFKKIGFE